MESKRDRPENQTGVPQIEVTPEMIDAGCLALNETGLLSRETEGASDLKTAMRYVLMKALSVRIPCGKHQDH